MIPLPGPAVVRSSGPPPRTNELPTSCPVTAITHTHKHSHAHSVYIDTNTRIPSALHVHPAQMKACILCSKVCGRNIINIAVTVDLNQALSKDIGCQGDRDWSATGVGNFWFIIDAVSFIKCNI